MKKDSIIALKSSYAFSFMALLNLAISVYIGDDSFKDLAIVFSLSGIVTSIVSIICYIAAKNAGDL